MMMMVMTMMMLMMMVMIMTMVLMVLMMTTMVMALLTLLPYERWKEAQPADISDRSKNFVCRIYLSHYSYLYLSKYFENVFVPLILFVRLKIFLTCIRPTMMNHQMLV